MTFLNISGNANTSWTLFTTNWVSNRTNPMLIFGFDAFTSIYFVIDDVSVVDTNTSVQLLTNPSFESSSASAVGWTPWCVHTCLAGFGNVSSVGCRTGRCFLSSCSGAASSLEYIAQAFPAVIGRTYNITFWYQRVKFGVTASTVVLYCGIV